MNAYAGFYDGVTPEQVSRRRRFAESLLAQGSDTSAVQHPLQAVARALQGAFGGYSVHRSEQEAQENQRQAMDDLIKVLPGQSGGVQVPPVNAAPVDQSMPRGFRNNNPLNIEAGVFTQGQPGFQGSDGRFARFASMDQGVRAANKLLDTYQNKHGLNTVNGIVGRWAPSADGNNVSAYAANVAARLGIDPNAPIPAEMRPQLIAAMVQHENGRPMDPQTVARALQPRPAGPPPIDMNVLRAASNPWLGSVGQSVASNLINQQFKPQDYDISHRPDGSIIAVNKKNPQDVRVMGPQDGGQGMIDFNARKAAAEKAATLRAEREATKPERDAQQKQAGEIVIQDIDRALAEVDKGILPTTGAAGALVSNIGGTAAANTKALVDTIRANIGFDQLAKMRQASPTGAALGSITEQEIKFLQALMGNLDQSQGEQQFKDNLRRIKNAFLDTIHGKGQGPAREKLSFEDSAGNGAQKPSGKTKAGVQWSVD